MSNIEYRKITLHSTRELGKDYEIVEYEREAVQRIMLENQIQFVIEIEEVDIKNFANKKAGTAYDLNLIVRKDDAEKVIELLDREGGFGYTVDLDETYNPDEESENIEEQEDVIKNSEKLKKVNEVEDSAFKEERDNDDPIKAYREDNGNITIEFNPIKFEDGASLIIKCFLIFTFLILMIMEIGLMIDGFKDTDYEIITAMFVAIVIETPFFVSLYNALNKKKGE